MCPKRLVLSASSLSLQNHKRKFAFNILHSLEIKFFLSPYKNGNRKMVGIGKYEGDVLATNLPIQYHFFCGG
jgi:hypothetical protein